MIAEKRREALQASIEKYEQEVNRFRSLYEQPKELAGRLESIETPYFARREMAALSMTETEWLDKICANCAEAGIKFNQRLLYSFHTALKTADWSPITVLAGVSGTGKSLLPEYYCRFGGIYFMSMAVQPDWDSPQSLFGYFNSVDNRFNATTLIRAMVQFSHDAKQVAKESNLSDSMFIVLLDEMNLAHVELYFSDMLSKLERRRNSDDDSEVQDPLKIAVKEILTDQEIKDKLNSVADTVREKLQKVANRTREKLKEMDSGIASTLHPVIDTNKLKWSDVFKNVSISGDEDIPINKRGSGVKRLVLLNFFRAEAERRAEERGNTGIIYAIEEPETSQHNNHQRTLIAALKELSAQPHTQILLTTHSAVLVKELDFNNIRLLNKNDLGETKVTKVEQPVLNYPSLNEVNYLAYDEITEEYHNELYGYLENLELLDAYKKLHNNTKHKYIRITKNKKTVAEEYILSTCIRHQIHHPENKHNKPFTSEKLKESTIMMRDFIINSRNQKS